MVVRLLSKAISRILAEVHVLSKGIILELISSLKNIRLKNLRGFIHPQNFFNNFQATVRFVASIVPFFTNDRV